MRMQRFITLLLPTFLLISISVSADTAKKVKLKGHLVDVACSIEQKDDLDYMRTKHSRACFQMPACVKSGYAILTADDKVIKFDAAGNALALKMIQSATKEKDFRITVRGKTGGELLQVSKIELDK